MARKRTVTPRRRTRRRKNSSKRSLFYQAQARAQKAAPRKRRRRKSKARRAMSRSGKRIRPVVIVSGGKFYRPRRSKAFKRPTRINGRRRRRSNPAVSIRRALSMPNIIRYLAIGGGMAAGSMVTSFVATGIMPFGGGTSIYPASIQSAMQKARPVLGLANLVVGAALAGKVKNPMLRDAALGIAAYGGFDLFTQILGLMGVTQLAGMDISGPFLGAGRFASQNRSYGVPAVVDGMDIPMVGDMETEFADSF